MPSIDLLERRLRIHGDKVTWHAQCINCGVLAWHLVEHESALPTATVELATGTKHLGIERMHALTIYTRSATAMHNVYQSTEMQHVVRAARSDNELLAQLLS